MYHDYLRNIDDLSTGLGVSESEGGLGLQGWKESDRADSISVKAGKEIVGIISENSSVSVFLPSSSRLAHFEWIICGCRWDSHSHSAAKCGFNGC